MSVSNYSTSPAANSSINGIDISEGCPAANVNNALRQMMADVRSRFSENEVTPQDFGAITGLDNAVARAANLAAFRAAMVELQTTGGGRFYLPPGDYYLDCSQPIYVPSNVTVEGVRGASVIRPNAASVPASTIGHVFDTGDPSAEMRAGVSIGPVVNNAGPIDPASVVNNVHFRGVTIICDYSGPDLVTNQLRGIILSFAYDSSVVDCYVTGTPNSGISTIGGGRQNWSRNDVAGCGHKCSAPASKNGLHFAGFMVTNDATLTSASIIIDGNHCYDNKDEGIAFALTKGIIVSNNVCIGNIDRGIEGDSGTAQTITQATHGQEVPADCIISGKYVDGAGSYGATSLQGITYTTANQGRITVEGNIIRNVSGTSGINVSQNANGIVRIVDNLLENVTVALNAHIIIVLADRAHVAANQIVAPAVGASTNSSGIQVFCRKSARVADNIIEGGCIYGISIMGGSASGSYALTHIAIIDNEIHGSVRDGILLAFPYNSTVSSIDVSGNSARALNSSASTSAGFIGLNGSGSASFAVTDMILMGNRFTYAGATRYPILDANIAAGSITNLVVRSNMLGAPTFPFGQRVINVAASATNLREFDNYGGLPGTPSYSVTNATADRTFDANATTIDELADILGTLIADLKAGNLPR